MSKRQLPRVMIVGGGELGSAVAHRLARSGMPPTIVDIDAPRCIRRRVCFAMACLEGTKEVEGVSAELVEATEAAEAVSAGGGIPVLTGDFRNIARELRPDVIVDARMLKRGSDIDSDVAPLVIGLGPGFTAGRNVHAVIETNRGHDLGRVIYSGSAEPFTGVPGKILGFAAERVIRAPESGTFVSGSELGKIVSEGEVVGVIAAGDEGNRSSTDVLAPISGLLRGLITDGTRVRRGQKIGDVDPRGSDVDPGTISDKGRAVGGGVLEAIMHWWNG